MELIFRPCTPADVDALSEFSRRTYYETFAHMNTAENMEAYLTASFDKEKLRKELQNPDSSFYFLYAGWVLSGYLKVNEAPAQTDINDEQSLEIERLYVAKESQSSGLGRELMRRALDIAYARKKSYVWLGVWEKNEKAILFYEKNGFYQIGTHSFIMGEEEQTDFIMRRDL